MWSRLGIKGIAINGCCVDVIKPGMEFQNGNHYNLSMPEIKYIYLICRNPFAAIIPEIIYAAMYCYIHWWSIHNLIPLYGQDAQLVMGTQKGIQNPISLGAPTFIIHQCPLYTETHSLQRAHKPQTNNCKELGRDAIYGPEWSRKWTSRQEIEGISFSHLYVQLSNDRNNQSLLWWTKHGINHLNVDSIAIQWWLFHWLLCSMLIAKP